MKKNIHDLKLHEIFTYYENGKDYGRMVTVARVPGGWVYDYGAFVPYNEEFKFAEKYEKYENVAVKEEFVPHEEAENTYGRYDRKINENDDAQCDCWEFEKEINICGKCGGVL